MLLRLSTSEREDIQQRLIDCGAGDLAALLGDAARDATLAVQELADATSGDIFTDAPECEESVAAVDRARGAVLEHLDGDVAPNFIRALHVDRTEHAAVDLIELTDGRVLALNGEIAMLCPSMAEYHDEKVDKSDYPTLEIAGQDGLSMSRRRAA